MSEENEDNNQKTGSGWFSGRPGPGRPKGLKNKSTLLKEEIEKATRDNPAVTPLEYMLNVMKDPNADLERRDKMAVAASNYLHSKKAPELPETGRDLSSGMTSAQLYAQALEILITSGAIKKELLTPSAMKLIEGRVEPQADDEEE